MLTILFEGTAFCFTGTLADVKRATAESEVRARGGLTCDRINERLDYLVVGDTPSPAWKHGSYGRKIEAALALHAGGASRPQLVQESAFIEALALTPRSNSGAVDQKVVVATYKFVASDVTDAFDVTGLESALTSLANEFRCHVRARRYRPLLFPALYSGADDGEVHAAVVVECRLVMHQALDAAVTPFLHAVQSRLTAIRGVDGTLRWFERVEGSADYIRLLHEVPSNTRLPAP